MLIIRYVTLYLTDQPQSRGHNPSYSRFLNSADPTILEPRTGFLRVPPGLCIKILSFDKKTIFHSHANKTPFHKKDCALAIGLILNVMRVFGDGSILLVLLVSTIFTTHSDLAYHFPNPEPHRR